MLPANFDPNTPFPPGALAQHVNGPPGAPPPAGGPPAGPPPRAAGPPRDPKTLLAAAVIKLMPLAQQDPEVMRLISAIKDFMTGGAAGPGGPMPGAGGPPPGAGAPPPMGPPPGAMPPRPM